MSYEKGRQTMRRMVIGMLTGLMVLGALLSGADSPAVQAGAATAVVTAAAGAKTLEAALLVAPAQCKAACFWTLQPGKTTVREFKAFALSAFTGAPSADAAPSRVLQGVEMNGVGLHASTATNATLDSVVEYTYVRVSPAEASAAAVNFNGIAPATIVQTFGNPEDAYLLFSKRQSGSYRLILLYSARSMVYIVRGTLSNGQACLALPGVENLTVYRFADAAAAKAFVGATATSDGQLPPSITANTKQKPADFTALAQSPASSCLMPVP